MTTAIGIIKTKKTVYCEICNCKHTRVSNVSVYNSNENEIKLAKEKALKNISKKYTCNICKSILSEPKPKKMKNEIKPVINTEAPDGFHAVLKSDVNREKYPNICKACDALKLCQENKNNWCENNRCMSSTVVTKTGEEIKRNDGLSVIFKRNA